MAPFPHATGGRGLFLDMGLGKTVTTLGAAARLLADRTIYGVLLVAPRRVVDTVWAQEAREWEHTKHLRFSVVRGSVRQRRQALSRRADIYLCNPELVEWVVEELRRGIAPHIDALVIDESSRFKSPSTKRFRALRGVLNYFRRRYILTGTPRPQGLLNLWSQMYLLDMGERLGSDYGRFRMRFFETNDYGGNRYVPRPGAEDYIKQLISDIVITIPSKGNIELPSLTYNNVSIELPEDAREAYDEFERRMFIEIEEARAQAAVADLLGTARTIEAANAAVLSMRCHQFANGAVFLDPPEPTDEQLASGLPIPRGPREWHVFHDAKLDALEEIIDETGSPVLVAYQFKHDLDRIQKRFSKPGKPLPVLSDGLNAAETERLVNAWNAGALPILLAHPKSAGHGLNLQKGPGHTLVFFSLTWSVEQHDQMIKRIHRSGQESPVIVHYILAKDTVDEAIHLAVQSNAEAQQQFLDALRAYQLDAMDLLS